MRVIRVFPRRTNLTPTDPLAFVGNPPMIRPQADEVHVSCTFTWDIEDRVIKNKRGEVVKTIPGAKTLANAWGQYYPVKLGGPAFDDPCRNFVPGMYVKQGVTFTSRGCNNNCSFCLVSGREGKIREYENFVAGNIVQDNNLTQTSQTHWDAVISMLHTQREIELSGGLEASRITEQKAADLCGLKLKQLFLACDTRGALKPLERAVKLLQMPIRKIRCYVLLAYNGETISEARERLENVYHAGALPFAQLYQPPDKLIEYSQEWRDLARTFSRPAITLSEMNNKLAEVVA